MQFAHLRNFLLLKHHLWQALEALKEAAESTKNLTDTLERNPESIIYGKGDE